VEVEVLVLLEVGRLHVDALPSHPTPPDARDTSAPSSHTVQAQADIPWLHLSEPIPSRGPMQS
jgi:hypothetical protein